jgi:hypothetical protein
MNPTGHAAMSGDGLLQPKNREPFLSAGLGLDS